MKLRHDCFMTTSNDDKVPSKHALTGPEPGWCRLHRPGSGPVNTGYGMFTGLASWHLIFSVLVCGILGPQWLVIDPTGNYSLGRSNENPLRQSLMTLWGHSLSNTWWEGHDLDLDSDVVDGTTAWKKGHGNLSTDIVTWIKCCKCLYI